METEVVRRRQWVSHERFLDLFGAANLIPGPSSTELAIFLGYEQAGAPGLIVAGVCFILPAAILTTVLGWAYLRFGNLPHLEGVLLGIKPVVIAIVLQALAKLVPKAVKSPLLATIGLCAVVASLRGLEAITVFVAAGLAHALVRSSRSGEAPGLIPPLFSLGAATGSISLAGIFFFFVKAGALVFGGGYVLLAFLRSDLVDRWHWLTDAQLLDAIVVGQITPGPVFTTATFIGYVLRGVPGAVAATVGIFLPGFLLVAVSRPLLAMVRTSVAASAFLEGVNVAAVALMTVVSVQLGRAALVNGGTVVIGLVAGFLLFRGINSLWLIAGGAVAGLLLQS